VPQLSRGRRRAASRQLFSEERETPPEVTVRFHRRAHLPIVLASDLFNKSVAVPWWKELTLRFVE